MTPIARLPNEGLHEGAELRPVCTLLLGPLRATELRQAAPIRHSEWNLKSHAE